MDKWIIEHGIWVLTNSEMPPFASVNSLGKFLYLPGGEIPDAFPIEQMARGRDLSEEM